MAKEWKGKTRGGKFGYLFFIYLIRYLGVNAAYIFLVLVVIHFIPFAPKATASIWYYSRRILGKSRLRSIVFLLRNYYRLGQTLIDKVTIGNGLNKKYKFKFESYEKFIEILNNDKGAIIVGAHVGSWEIGSPFFKDYGKRINIVLYDAEHRRIKEVLEKNKIAVNYKIIAVNNDNLEHIFKIKSALDDKEYICFQGDRYVTQDKLLTCSFMGKEAKFPAGLFILASRMKVPVVFYFAMREPHKIYRFHFYIAKPIARKAGVKPEQELLEQYVQTLEKILKRYPEQWFNYYKFWG
ncbi:MAG: acyltransferase [Prevotellaceae bacterium]|jgi:predicted LPLAT superfamily acyltransferase|nr:acyltransferase [Prevotellaceae bacterium]